MLGPRLNTTTTQYWAFSPDVAVRVGRSARHYCRCHLSHGTSCSPKILLLGSGRALRPPPGPSPLCRIIDSSASLLNTFPSFCSQNSAGKSEGVGDTELVFTARLGRGWGKTERQQFTGTKRSVIFWQSWLKSGRFAPKTSVCDFSWNGAL